MGGGGTDPGSGSMIRAMAPKSSTVGQIEAWWQWRSLDKLEGVRFSYRCENLSYNYDKKLFFI
jgi:hypothetical protein